MKISLGLKDLDKTTGGLHRGQLLTITGRSAMGKTAFAITLLVIIGIKQQIPVAFFSLEMSNVQIVKRILKKWWSDNFNITAENSEDIKLADWLQLLYKAPIYLDDIPTVSIDDMEDKITNLISNYGVKVVFIDYLQLINGFEVNPDNIMKRLKGIAINHGISIVIISQLYKDFYPLRPYDSDSDDDFFRGATKVIMNNSDAVILLYRHDYYTPIEDSTEPQNKAEAIIFKGNNEQMETVPLTFLPEFASFTDYVAEKKILNSIER
ncbi:MAG: DnaB-like helicase C-terminal domain-containing protein [Muribaculaceae bacterium]|nr:DnaB-like helicase C-terminal domain-containing protein [Muribaculaceae bacterium]